MVSRTTFMPTPLPDEHLLSVIARRFLMMNHNSFNSSVRAISSNVNALNPNSVWRTIYEDIAAQYGQSLSREVLIANHTLVPYYTSFLDECSQILATPNVISPIENRIMPTRQKFVRYAAIWRWCPCCVENDIDHYGTSYWHVSHQLPSILRCPEHNYVLLDSCSHCNFEYNGLQHGLPPSEEICPKCHSHIEPKTCENSSLIDWIEDTSLQLRHSQQSTTIEQIRKLMREQIGYANLPPNLSVEQRKSLSFLQNQFSDWLDDDILGLFFKGVDRNSLTKPANTILKLPSVAYKNVSLPPISILLMLKFLGIEEVLSVYPTVRRHELQDPKNQVSDTAAR